MKSLRQAQMSGKSIRLVIFATLILAALHAAVLFWAIPQFKGGPDSPVNLQGSPDGYDQLATNLLSGHGYRFYPDTAPTLMREPGYPVFLAGLFRLFGPGFTSVKLCNMVMAFCAAWLMVPLARKILPVHRFDAPIVFLPSLLFLLHPGTLIAESRAGVEIPFALLLVCFLRLVCAAVDLPRITYFAAVGLVLGVIVLFRSTPLLFPVFLFTYLLARKRSTLSLARAVLCFSVMMLSTLAVLTPWIVRNLNLTGKIIPTASVLGVSAEAGQYINEHLFEGRPWWLLDREAARQRDALAIEAGYRFEDGPNGYYQTFYKTSDELAFSGYLAKRVVRTYASHPWLFARVFAQNLFNFWFAGKTWVASAAAALFQLPYLLIALIGLRGSFRKENNPSAILALFIGYMMLVHAPILAQARYSVPLVPLVSLLAGAGLLSILRAFHTEESASPARLLAPQPVATRSVAPTR